MSKLQRVGLALLVFGLTAAVAVWLGAEAGDFFNERKFEEYKERRGIQSRAVLKKMGTISVGDNLPNHYFEDLGRNTVHLSDAIHGKTALIFLNPDCYTCIEEVELLH